MGSNGLMRVFWPLDFPRNNLPGVLVGWRNSELDIFVVDVMNGVDVGLLPFSPLHPASRRCKC